MCICFAMMTHRGPSYSILEVVANFPPRKRCVLRLDAAEEVKAF